MLQCLSKAVTLWSKFHQCNTSLTDQSNSDTCFRNKYVTLHIRVFVRHRDRTFLKLFAYTVSLKAQFTYFLINRQSRKFKSWSGRRHFCQLDVSGDQVIVPGAKDLNVFQQVTNISYVVYIILKRNISNLPRRT